MRRFLFPRALLSAAVLGSVCLGIAAAPNGALADDPSHLVAYGETLYSIARDYGVSPAALAAANGITTESWVYAGQALTIPGSSSSTSTQNTNTAPSSQIAKVSSGGTYTVQAGDSLTGLARTFGVSIDAIAEANNIPPNGFLYTGTQLTIPGAASTAAKPVAAPAPASDVKTTSESAKPTSNESASASIIDYVVRAGDTLYGIAIKHGVTMASIQIASDMGSPYVYTGQTLKIPSGAAPAAKTEKPAAPASTVKTGVLARAEDVPVYKQKQTLTCEQAAASMALRGELSEDEIVDAMPRSENPFEGIRGETNFELYGGLTHYGTYAQGLQKGLSKLGRHSTAYYGQPYDKFKESIISNLKQGRPVIWWTTWRESVQRPQWVEVTVGIKVPLTPFEHAVVIVEASETGVTYHDPYDGTIRFATWANHERASGYFNNMALVVF